MEKKRWSLIFIGLCLALVFSVSSVEAQAPTCVSGEDTDPTDLVFIVDVTGSMRQVVKIVAAGFGTIIDTALTKAGATDDGGG